MRGLGKIASHADRPVQLYRPVPYEMSTDVAGGGATRSAILETVLQSYSAGLAGGSTIWQRSAPRRTELVVEPLVPPASYRRELNMASRPNVVLITTDHLRFDTLGCTGNPVIETPGIDRLAESGTLFTNFFVQNPVCAPSRATIMTGRYPRNHGVRWNGSSLNENETTLVEFFKRRGYDTVCVGKHHLAQRRFRESLDHLEADSIRRDWREREDGDYTVTDPNPFEQYVRDLGYEYKTGYALKDFRKNLGAVPSELPEECHLDFYVGMKSLQYLRGVDPERPFFLWVGFYGPHHPYVPSGRFAHMYDPDAVPAFHRAPNDLKKKPVEYRLYFESQAHKFRGFKHADEATFRRMKAAYYGMVSQLDRQVELITEELTRGGLDANTIVTFLSDHGEFTGDHGIPAKAPFLLDCMLHVPFILRVPRGMCAGNGARHDELAESVDVFPTVARLAGFEPPEWIQGRDLSPLLTGAPASVEQEPRTAVFAEAVDKRCYRTREWKFIHYPAGSKGELYHLTDDPHELDNLYEERVEIRDRMILDLYRHMDAIEDVRHPSYARFGGVDPSTGKRVTHYMTW